jgi:predicted aspartyl protease
MGRIITTLRISNARDQEKNIRCDALVDTGASHVVLPKEWKERLGELEFLEEVEFQAANQTKGKGEIYAPVKIQVANFRPVFDEVLFIDMEKNPDGGYEPLVGYIPLEKIPVAVDMLGRRLVKVRALDLK